MRKDDHLIYESLVQSRAPISDEQAAKMIADKIKGTPNLNIQNIKMYVQRYMGLVGKAPSDVDFIAAMVHDNLQNMGMGENAEDRSVQAGGAIEDITDIQKQSMNLLKQHGFHVNKVSNAHAEQQGGPMVYMGRKTGAMHQVAEVDPQGMINEETPEEYLANHVQAEDAEGRSNAQHAAIAISLQKAGKKPS